MVMEEFDRWYRAEHPRVLGACAALSGDADTAREATDEAFARALARWDSVVAMSSPGAWVHTVALNFLRRAMRRRAREEFVHRGRHAGVVPAPVANPEVWAAVRGLPERQRLAIVLRYVADLPEADVAEVMGVSRGTVASTLSAARSRLAAVLADDSNDTLEVPRG
jgi:DNA-directed RNA polymerase specialized sigma24 family protein